MLVVNGWNYVIDKSAVAEKEKNLRSTLILITRQSSPCNYGDMNGGSGRHTCDAIPICQTGQLKRNAAGERVNHVKLRRVQMPPRVRNNYTTIMIHDDVITSRAG